MADEQKQPVDGDTSWHTPTANADEEQALNAPRQVKQEAEQEQQEEKQEQ